MTENVVPVAGLESTVMVPPCAWTMVCTVESPRPVPPCARLKKGSKMRWRSSRQRGCRRCPRPPPARLRARRRRECECARASLAMATAALRSRLINTCLSWPASHSASIGSRFSSTWHASEGRVGAQQLERLAHHRVDAGGDELGRRRAGELEVALHQARQAVGLPEDEPGQPLSGGAGGIAHQHLRGAAHRGERVADLVGELRREAAQGGQVVDAVELALDAAQLGEILEDDQQPLGVAQRRDGKPQNAGAARRLDPQLRAAAGDQPLAPGSRSSMRRRITSSPLIPRMVSAAGLAKVTTPSRVAGHQARRHRPDDLVLELGQLAQVALAGGQPATGARELLARRSR